MLKKCLFSLLMVMPTIVFAQNKSLNVSANIIAGCKVTAEDVAFGTVPRNSSKTINSNIIVHCPKNTHLTMTISGNNYSREGYSNYYPNMKHSKENTYIPYKMELKNSNPNLITLSSRGGHINTITQQGYRPGLGPGFWLSYTYRGFYSNYASIRTNRSQPTTLTLSTTITIPSTQASGDYQDVATITLTY